MGRVMRLSGVAVAWLGLFCGDCGAETPIVVDLQDADSGLTSPQGNYRWMDTADQLYAATYQEDYNYTQASVTITYYTDATTLHGTLVAQNLKPNFTYQLKLVGNPDVDLAGNESIGFTGRWWQEEWNGSEWTNGQNLNNKGDGYPPSPNDLTYLARRDVEDATSPTGRHYRYTAYLCFDYFITDAEGNASLGFQADSSYHVLWKSTQRARGDNDGPLKPRTFEVTLPDPAGAYDAAYAETTVEVFGEWERLPMGGVTLADGFYEAEFVLTEESFHGGGLAGGWAAAMSGPAGFHLWAQSPCEEFELDHDWVYQNTAATTQDRHHSVLTIRFGWDILPGETFDVKVTEDGGPLTRFTLVPVDTDPSDEILVYHLVGGRVDATSPSAPGYADLVFTLTNQPYGYDIMGQASLQLRAIGDVTGDGFVNAMDKVSVNAWLNGLPRPGDSERHIDLTGDGFVNAIDKVQMNRQLNGLGIL